MLAGLLSHLQPALRVFKKFDAGCRHSVSVTDIEQISVLPMFHDFGNSSDICCNHRHFACHRFQRNKTKRLVFAGKQQYIRHGKQLSHIVLLAQKKNMIGYSMRTSQPFCLGPLGTIANHQQLCAAMLENLCKNRNHIFNSLQWPEV